MIVDISSNNGIVDFNKLKIAGVTDIIIRTSEGYGSEDKMVITNAKNASSIGIPVSYYHFAYPDIKNGGTALTDSTAEANYFVSCIKNLPKYKYLIIDLEQQTYLNKNDYQTWLQNFLNIVEKSTGTKCIIYTYKDYLDQHLPSIHTFGKNYQLWIANYGNVTNPPIPIGWSDWFMWQYSSNSKISDINSTFDFSKYKQ